MPPATVAFDALWPPPADFRSAEVMQYTSVDLRAGDRVATVQATSRLYDRGLLDMLLAKVASKNGARIQWGARDITVADDRHVTWNGGNLRPRVLLLCDGPMGWASRFVENLQRPREMRFGQAWRIPRASDRPDTINISFSQALPGGRLQQNPVGSRTVVWAFRRDRPPTRRDAIAAMPGSALRAPDLVSLGPARPDPVFALPGRISGGGLLLAGGAAGQGGLELGFLAGVDAGRVAAEAVLEGTPTARFLYENYEEPWKRRWLRGLETFRTGYNRFADLPPREQETILEPWEDSPLDLRDVIVHDQRMRLARHFSAFKVGVRNAHRMRSLRRTYQQLVG